VKGAAVERNNSEKLQTSAPLSVLFLSILVASCTVGPDYQKPAAPTPETFRFQESPTEASSIADLAWWNIFDDKALQALIAEGLKNNYDLQVAVARIEEARNLVDVARSEGKPQLGYQAYVQGQTAIIPGANRATSSTYGDFAGLLNAAWEIDVWGRIKRSTEAAQANVLNQEDVRRGIMLTLVSDIAAGYFRLLEFDRELSVAEESASTYKKTFDLFDDRFQAGKDSELPVTRAKAAYDDSNTTIATLKRQIAQQEDALSVLVGGTPRANERGRSLTELVLPQTPLGATTDLLKRRPDILAAEQVMVSANAEIGVAEANFYPRVGLSALGGGEGLIEHTFQGFGVWSAGLNVAGPIISGGRLEAIYRERKAFWDEAVAQYRKTVQVAFQETSDALIAQRTLVAQREALESQIKSLRRSIDVAFLRYDAGRASYFEILEAQQRLYPAEYALAQTQQDQLIAVVNLYKALGGGWNMTPERWVEVKK
jgi:multidrug efflux system outer membrane protein